MLSFQIKALTLTSHGTEKLFKEVKVGQVEKYCIGNGRNAEEEFKQIT